MYKILLSFVKNALFTNPKGPTYIPYNPLGLRGIEIPAVDKSGTIKNMAQFYLDKNPHYYEQFEGDFDKLPNTKLKQEVAQNDGLKAITVAIARSIRDNGGLNLLA